MRGKDCNYYDLNMKVWVIKRGYSESGIEK